MTTDYDLSVPFRGLLILGRILGVIPNYGKVFRRPDWNLKSSLLNFSGIVTLFRLALLAFSFTLGIIVTAKTEKGSILVIAKSISIPLFAFWGLFIYAYFLSQRHHFRNIFKMWHKCCQSLTYAKTDVYLYSTVVTISVIMLTSGVLENALLHTEYFTYFDHINSPMPPWNPEVTNGSIAEIYYRRSHDFWYQLIGYQPYLAVMVFIIHKWILYGLNYADILASLLFRALYFKFKALLESAEEQLPLDTSYAYGAADKDQQAWNKLANDHDSLCQLLSVMNDFFSPLLFISYTGNIYYICMLFFGGINPARTHGLVHSIYAPWSFIHGSLRVFLLTYFAAKVHEYVYKIRDIVKRCPVELQNGTITKLWILVNGPQNLGFSGLGSFVITKAFMLSILNVVFTIEIILLQGLSADST